MSMLEAFPAEAGTLESLLALIGLAVIVVAVDRLFLKLAMEEGGRPPLRR